MREYRIDGRRIFRIGEPQYVSFACADGHTAFQLTLPHAKHKIGGKMKQAISQIDKLAGGPARMKVRNQSAIIRSWFKDDVKFDGPLKPFNDTQETG